MMIIKLGIKRRRKMLTARLNGNVLRVDLKRLKRFCVSASAARVSTESAHFTERRRRRRRSGENDTAWSCVR